MQATLALFAARRTSGILVNVGFHQTSVVPSMSIEFVIVFEKYLMFSHAAKSLGIFLRLPGLNDLKMDLKCIIMNPFMVVPHCVIDSKSTMLI